MVARCIVVLAALAISVPGSALAVAGVLALLATFVTLVAALVAVLVVIVVVVTPVLALGVTTTVVST